jgi:hypothetical protein
MEFQQNPDASRFQQACQQSRKTFSAIANPSFTQQEKMSKVRVSYFAITYLVLGVCLLVFFLNWMQELAIVKKDPRQKIMLVTPVQYYLLFDAPTALVEVSKVMRDFPIGQKRMSEQIEQSLQRLQDIVYFRGFYPWLVVHLSSEEKLPKGEKCLFLLNRDSCGVFLLLASCIKIFCIFCLIYCGCGC